MTAATDMTGPGGHGDDDQDRRRRAGPAQGPGRGQLIALFRYELIGGLLGDGLSRAERSELMAAICAVEHPGPDGGPVSVSPPTIRRWIAAYREGGFAGLVPKDKDQPSRCPEPVRATALALKDANPKRTARMIRAIMLDTYRDRPGDVPGERTLQRWFGGLPVPAEPGISQAAGVFGRFEALCRRRPRRLEPAENGRGLGGGQRGQPGPGEHPLDRPLIGRPPRLRLEYPLDLRRGPGRVLLLQRRRQRHHLRRGPRLGLARRRYQRVEPSLTPRADPHIQRPPGHPHRLPGRPGVLAGRDLPHHRPPLPRGQRRVGSLPDQHVPEQPDRPGPLQPRLLFLFSLAHAHQGTSSGQ